MNLPPLTPLITIIVPVNNTAPYLNRCIESIVHQTYPKLEIILVDDGSADASPQILEAWEKRDRRIRCIHQEYAGVSAARNRGIREASGEYICFVDSDDELDLKSCESLLACSLKYDAELVIGSYDTPCAGVRKSRAAVAEKSLSNDEAMELLLSDRITVAVWGKLYAAALVKSFSFVENMVHEDRLFTYEITAKASRCVLSGDTVYHYMTREASLSHTFSDRNTSDMLKAQELVISFLSAYYSREDMRVFRKRLQNFWEINNLLSGHLSCYSASFAASVKALQKDRRSVLLKQKRFVLAAGMPARDRIKGIVVLFCPGLCPVFSKTKKLAEGVLRKYI